MNRKVALNYGKFLDRLEQKRMDLAMSGGEMMRQAGISASTLTRIRQGRGMHADILVGLLAWMGETDLEPYIIALDRSAMDVQIPGQTPLFD